VGLELTWHQIAIRIALAAVASLIIGLNRDEHGNPAGMRTTMLVCLAATLAMLQVNLLLPLAGKSPSSFVVMDLMRLPLGILSGIGFIGAGVIIKRDGNVSGVTTAATIWFVTVLGLLFGGGNLYLGVTGSVAAFTILWALKLIEKRLPHVFRGMLNITFSNSSLSEADIRRVLSLGNMKIVHWNPVYEPTTTLSSLHCEVKWKASPSRTPDLPHVLVQLRSLQGIARVSWEE
jgi:putative Mg2+ transporter-C (MgtC) family protein